MTRACWAMPNWSTTAIYTKVATKVLRSVTSPLDLLTPLGPKEEPPK